MYLYPKPTSQKKNQEDFNSKKTLSGLPFEVKFCKKCIISNQRPNSEFEYKHTKHTQKKTIKFSNDGVCDACSVANSKQKKIDWDLREKELIDLCNKNRGDGTKYDCIVPGSGGKDSFYTSHILKYKYGMNPLTITWAPHMYTSWGLKNMENWSNSGFDNYLVTPNRKVQRLLTRLALENLFHPFQPFQFGQKFLAPKIAHQLGIGLVFYGENQAEYGNDSDDLESPTMNQNFFSMEKMNEENLFLGGVSMSSLKSDFGLTNADLQNYLPMKLSDVKENKIEVHFLGHYLKWHPQQNYYYSVKHGNFVTSPERMPGTYTKYSSIDDKMEDFNYYTLGIKFGLGWTSNIASFEIRDGDITREEGLALSKKYDLEFPKRFAEDLYSYVSIPKDEYPIAYKNFEEPNFDEKYFLNLHDRFRSPHLWKKENDEWSLRCTAWKDAEESNFLQTSQDKSAMEWKGNKN
ncbi:N-acetyl sugar amidotransferase [Candidatus Pelagibacter sp.]|nr:N-acetyl sugar amidotransferase [Candidatus Pelagibacter sp.]